MDAEMDGTDAEDVTDAAMDGMVAAISTIGFDRLTAQDLLPVTGRALTTAPVQQTVPADVAAVPAAAADVAAAPAAAPDVVAAPASAPDVAAVTAAEQSDLHNAARSRVLQPAPRSFCITTLLFQTGFPIQGKAPVLFLHTWNTDATIRSNPGKHWICIAQF